jgi:hypothetical protein
LYALIKRGDIDKTSFGFIVDEDAYDSLTHTRRILKFKTLCDVSAVDMPAYEGTSIDVADGSAVSARDYFSGRIEIEKLTKENEKRKKLYLLTF